MGKDQFPVGRSGWPMGNQDRGKRGLSKSKAGKGDRKPWGCPLSVLVVLVPLVIAAECIWGGLAP